MDLADIIVNLSNGLTQPLWRLLWVLGGLVGTLCLGLSLQKMQRASRFADQQIISWGDMFVVALIATLMLNMSTFINAMWNSMGSGTTTYAAISYSGTASLGRLSKAIDAVLTLASIYGGYFVFKGLWVLKKATVGGQSSSGSGDEVWRAMTHMLGGSGLINITSVIDAFRQTAGLSW
jgi:magnesium-transporting ATPase (P-type)